MSSDRAHRDARAAPILTIVLIGMALALGGCSRQHYRIQADKDAYQAIAQRNEDPRWASNFQINVDPRSRYYDRYNPDRPPMPPDDPASDVYMHRVDGKKGWRFWGVNGFRDELENPGWREALAGYVKTTEKGAVVLGTDSAVKLGYINSPDQQRQLETLYQSALAVTAERFNFSTQFNGGVDAFLTRNGPLVPAGFEFDRDLGQFVVGTSAFAAAAENNRFTVAPTLEAQRRFATASELLIGFANSFVLEFTGGGSANLSASILNFSLIQPLLRGAGRDVALEQLVQSERNLLANLRAYSQYRQGFYTLLVIGELGVSGPQLANESTTIQSFGGQGGVGGYLGLLQQIQQIHNSEANLRLQLQTLARLEALLQNDLIDLVQVDQFRQNVESDRSNLLLLHNSYELALDRYRASTLGLPPDLPIELNEELIRQFQLVPTEATDLQESIIKLQSQVGALPNNAPVAAIQGVLQDARQLLVPLGRVFEGAQRDLDRMEAAVPARTRTLSEKAKQEYKEDRAQLRQRLDDLKKEYETFNTELTKLETGLTEANREATTRRLISWTANFLQIAERVVLVPARARLETITVEPVKLKPEKALQVALSNRLDFMNGRAALVDQWRQIQVRANALKAELNITATGDIRTASNDPLNFNSATGRGRLGVEFKAPLNRLLERNAYRTAQINYEQNVRALIQSQDSLNLGVRALLRNLDQLRNNLEIQRRAVAIAIRRVEQTQLALSPPRQPPEPGQRSPINPTTAINLLGAQTALRDSQDALLGVWLNYYATRLRLYRELGILELDSEGRWVDRPIDLSPNGSMPSSDFGVETLPPPAVKEDPISTPTFPADLRSLRLIDAASPLGELSDGGPDFAVLPTEFGVANVPVPTDKQAPGSIPAKLTDSAMSQPPARLKRPIAPD